MRSLPYARRGVTLIELLVALMLLLIVIAIGAIAARRRRRFPCGKGPIGWSAKSSTCTASCSKVTPI